MREESREEWGEGLLDMRKEESEEKREVQKERRMRRSLVRIE